MPINSTNNINLFYSAVEDRQLRTAIREMAQNSGIKEILERTPVNEIISLGTNYNQLPDVYNDALTGKIKYIVPDFSMKAFPLFSKSRDVKKLLDPNSLAAKAIELFSICKDKSKGARSIVIKKEQDTITTRGYDKTGYCVIKRDKQEKHFATEDKSLYDAIINTTDNKIILIRD